MYERLTLLDEKIPDAIDDPSGQRFNVEIDTSRDPDKGAKHYIYTHQEAIELIKWSTGGLKVLFYKDKEDPERRRHFFIKTQRFKGNAVDIHFTYNLPLYWQQQRDFIQKELKKYHSPK